MGLLAWTLELLLEFRQRFLLVLAVSGSARIVAIEAVPR